jgi:hypothetical protein
MQVIMNVFVYTNVGGWNQALDAIGTSLFNNSVPTAWAAVAPPSLMPLAAWAVDLEVCPRPK